MKFLGRGQMEGKKHGPEYRRQWHKLHIGIDAENPIKRVGDLNQVMSVISRCLVMF